MHSTLTALRSAAANALAFLVRLARRVSGPGAGPKLVVS